MRDSSTPNTRLWLPFMLMAGLCACSESDPDAELQRFVEATAKAASERDTGYFRRVIATSYVDFRGNDRDRAIDMIRGFFLVNQKIDAAARIVEIEWSGTESARLTIAAQLDLNTHSASPELELELLRDGADWTVIGARWDDNARSRLQ